MYLYCISGYSSIYLVLYVDTSVSTYAHTTTYVPVRMCLLHVCFPSIVGKSTRLNESMIFLSGGESSGPNARSKNKGCYEREKGREKEK